LLSPATLLALWISPVKPLDSENLFTERPRRPMRATKAAECTRSSNGELTTCTARYTESSDCPRAPSALKEGRTVTPFVEKRKPTWQPANESLKLKHAITTLLIANRGESPAASCATARIPWVSIQRGRTTVIWTGNARHRSRSGFGSQPGWGANQRTAPTQRS